MTSNRMLSTTPDLNNGSTIDRLALGRVQHFQSRENRLKSVSDDEVDAISDWSESDRECCPLSDFESSSNNNGNDDLLDELFDEDITGKKLAQEIYLASVLQANETLVPMIDDSTTSTRISFTNGMEKPQQSSRKKTIAVSKRSDPPLLPVRRLLQSTQRRPSNRSTTAASQLSYSSRAQKFVTPSPTRSQQRQETTLTTISLNTPSMKDSIVSSSCSFDDQHHRPQRQSVSPNFSQLSVPRVYEIKKVFVDDCDYGRLTDLSSSQPTRARSRQKWGTIVHPPFPLGYQHIAPEQLTQTVERLSSPARCRERHTPIETPSKRYLTVEETEALINRLSKVKTIRSPDQYWPVQRQSRSVNKLSNHWKGVGIST